MLKIKGTSSTLYQAGHSVQVYVSFPICTEFGLISESVCCDFMVTSHVNAELNFSVVPQPVSLDSVLWPNQQIYLQKARFAKKNQPKTDS